MMYCILNLFADTNRVQEIAFSVGLSTNFSGGQGRIINFDKVFINHGAGFNTRTRKFTAMLSGVYVFHFHALSEIDKSEWIDLYHNFRYVNSLFGRVPTSYGAGSNSKSLELLSGDEVYLSTRNQNTVIFGLPNQIYCTFSGYLLNPTFDNLPVIGK